MNKTKNKKIYLILPIASVLLLAAVLTGCTYTNSTVTTNSAVGSTNTSANVNTSSGKPVLSGDICGEFSSDFVARAIGMNIVQTEKKTDTGISACRYYTNNTNGQTKYVEIGLENLNVDSVKNGYIKAGASTTTDSQITQNHFIGVRTDKSYRGVYLVLNPNEMLTVSGGEGATPLTDSQLVQFAVQVSQQLSANYSWSAQ